MKVKNSPDNNYGYHHQVGFNELLARVSGDQLRAVLHDLQEPGKRETIIEELSKRNPDLMTELFRQDKIDVEEHLERERLLDGLVVLQALRAAYDKHLDLEPIRKMFDNDQSQAA